MLGCVMRVVAMSGHVNTWGHVTYLRRGQSAWADMVF